MSSRVERKAVAKPAPLRKRYGDKAEPPAIYIGPDHPDWNKYKDMLKNTGPTLSEEQTAEFLRWLEGK